MLTETFGVRYRYNPPGANAPFSKRALSACAPPNRERPPGASLAGTVDRPREEMIGLAQTIASAARAVPDVFASLTPVRAFPR